MVYYVSVPMTGILKYDFISSVPSVFLNRRTTEEHITEYLFKVIPILFKKQEFLPELCRALYDYVI